APLELPVGRVDRGDRLGPAVVARTDRAVQVGGRVADRDEQRLARLVIRRRHPHGAAAVLPRVVVLGGIGPLLGEITFQVVALGRGLGEGTPPAAVLGRRDSVPSPHERAAGGVERLYVTPDAVLGARGADDHVVADHERGHRLGVARLRPVAPLDRPLLFAGPRVALYQLVV